MHHGSDFAQFYKSRHSVRLYDAKSLPFSCEQLLSCIELAQHCPNACNRKAVRVKIVQDKERNSEISRIQGGSAGFGENSGAMLIITADISLYTKAEHNMAMVNSGIFIMNLVYALHYSQLASCVLNCSLSIENDALLKNLLNVPDQEVFAAIISVSNLKENETIKIACSPKRKIENIVSIL